MENKLKPCPFCLSEAEMHIREDSLDCFAYKKSEIPKTARLVETSLRLYVPKPMLWKWSTGSGTLKKAKNTSTLFVPVVIKIFMFTRKDNTAYSAVIIARIAVRG